MAALAVCAMSAVFLNIKSDAQLQERFPNLAPLPEVPQTPDNPTTEAKIELGKLLFFDRRTSGDVSTSCSSCHDPHKGWGDGNPVSKGYPGTVHWRNSQTVVNAAYLKKLFWAGEDTSLESQADSAVTGNLAGNGDPDTIEERLAQVPEYVRLFKEAFGVERPTYPLALKAIAVFERTVVTKDAPFDQYMNGDKKALSDSAKRGMELFQGKARCIQCHNGPLMSDESFHNIGVPKNPLFENDAQRQIALRFQHYARGVSEEVYRGADRDLGLYYTTKRPEDKGKFRTPPLRYIEYTAPYMHNGVFESLEEVVDFYNKGGGDDPRKSPLLQSLDLTKQEMNDLLEFLKSLSGEEIIVEEPPEPPYAVLDE
ncbi:MAG: hypothetical protein A3C36_04365 [Omnitrophica WOR_2 bacterium RIFCSPHIGHO2_02_FULL_52_10]|nr:MAG: hypothetical protein A3C36_04365 [Omnitrophica WOR_2 bacterium RIFCSPHIGHO2_02_FULL_52_10]